MPIRRRALIATVTAAVALVTVLVVASPWSGSPGAAATYPLWSDDTRAGLSIDEVRTFGQFDAAAVIGGGACAWVGVRRAFAWPKGFRVRLRPVELIDADGRVVAKAGQSITVRGAVISGAETAAFPTCGSTGGINVDSINPPPPQRPRSTTRYPLWSDGWNPSQASMTGHATGIFAAALVPGGICAWIGFTMSPFEWPAGWTVRFYPDAQLLDASGKVLAVDGQRITVPGARIRAKAPLPPFPCGSGTVHEVFAVTGPPTR